MLLRVKIDGGMQVHGAGELYMKDVTLQGGGASTHDTQALHVSSKAFGQGVRAVRANHRYT